MTRTPVLSSISSSKKKNEAQEPGISYGFRVKGKTDLGRNHRKGPCSPCPTRCLHSPLPINQVSTKNLRLATESPRKSPQLSKSCISVCISWMLLHVQRRLALPNRVSLFYIFSNDLLFSTLLNRWLQSAVKTSGQCHS